jgi:hypothetical protein
MRLFIALALSSCWPAAWGATGSDGRWSAGIGDPTVLGWVTVLAYGLAATLAAKCARRFQPRGFWWAVAALMAFLAINKQLDLQSWVTEVGRDMAKAHGWYEGRHRVQAFFILCMALVGALGGLLAVHAWWPWIRRIAPTLVGVVVVIVFVVGRAASFHHVDQFLFSEVGGLRWNWLLELGGIALVCWGCWHARRKARRRMPRAGSAGI